MGMLVNSFWSAGASGSAHTYWRIKCVTQDTAGAFGPATGGYMAANEIEMRATVGGADQCNGGTPICDSAFQPAAKAFDNSTGTSDWWACNGTGNAAWIGYQFASPVAVNEILYRNRDANGWWQVPLSFTVDYSDDGTNWFVSWSETTPIGTWTTTGSAVLFVP